jgi:pyrophosphatase PpaX
MTWPGDASWTEGIGTPLTAQFGRYVSTPSAVDDLIAAYRVYQLANHDRLVRAYDGIPGVVAALRDRGHRLGIVTSKGDELAVRGLRHVGLRDAFETVVGCDSCRKHKPDPEPVHVALARLGATPDAAVFVGDSTHDIEAGNAAGVQTIGVVWGAFSRDQLERSRPTRIAEQPQELPRLIANMALSFREP